MILKKNSLSRKENLSVGKCLKNISNNYSKCSDTYFLIRFFISHVSNMPSFINSSKVIDREKIRKNEQYNI